MTRFRYTFAASLLALALCAAPAGAAPEDPPAKKGPKGSAYTNARMGIAARSPAGWQMVADKGAAPSTWTRLVTFNDRVTDGQAVLSARPRSAPGLDALLGTVRADWDKNPKLRVSSMRKIEGAPGQAGTVVVDATFVRTPKKKPGKPGSPPPPPQPPVTYRVQATYYLASGYEFLLYATGQQTHWSRLRGPLSQLRSSVKFASKGSTGPTGEGSYRDERRGFACRFPKDYTVVVPQRGNHLVQFESVNGDAPVLGVYGFKWPDSLEKDAERLVAWYEDDKAGEATTRTTEVGGNEAILVTARAEVGGVDKVFLLALFKREDRLFRVRAAMPAATEAGGTRIFRKFLNSFKFVSR